MFNKQKILNKVGKAIREHERVGYCEFDNDTILVTFDLVRAFRFHKDDFIIPFDKMEKVDLDKLWNEKYDECTLGVLCAIGTDIDDRKVSCFESPRMENGVAVRNVRTWIADSLLNDYGKGIKVYPTDGLHQAYIMDNRTGEMIGFVMPVRPDGITSIKERN